MMADDELKQQGMNILIQALGFVNAERFISLIEREPFDYSEWHQTLWENLTQYISVEQDIDRKGRRGQTVRIIDFENPENNEFLCTNQFNVSGVHQNIIPDIVW